MPEILPNRVRGEATAIPVLTQWVTNAVAVLFFPLALNQVGKVATFGFLAAMALLQSLFAWRIFCRKPKAVPWRKSNVFGVEKEAECLLTVDESAAPETPE